MKKLLILIFLSISLSGYSQFVFKNGKSTARIDTIATNGNYFYFVNRTTNQICQAQVRNQALVVQNIYTFTDSLTLLRAFRDSINMLKLTLSTKFDYGDTVDILETQYHAAQTYLGKDSTAFNSNLLQGKDSTYIKANWGSSTITASDGVYMDGDTVKMGGTFNEVIYIVSHTGSPFSLKTINPENSNNFTQLYGDYVISLFGNYDFASQKRAYFVASDTVAGITTDGNGVLSKIEITPTNITAWYDTTYTTDNSIMTEAQVKREIAAASKIYPGEDDPVSFTRQNIDASFYATRVIANSTTVAEGTIVGLSGPTGFGVYGGATGNGRGGVFSTESGIGLSINGGESGRALVIQHSAAGNASNLLEAYVGTSLKVSINKDGVIYDSKPHVALYRNTDLTISATQNVWYKISGFTAKDADMLTVQGDSIQFQKAGSYMIDVTISFSGLNNEVWELAIFKGATMEEPSQLRYTGTSDIGNMTCSVYMPVTAGQWVSFKIRNTTDGDDPTIKRFSARIIPIHLSN